MMGFLRKVGDKGKGFLDQTAKSSETAYLILLCIFIISNIMYQIGWQTPYLKGVWRAHQILFAGVMWGSAVYLFYIIAEWLEAWKRIPLMIAVGACIFIVTILVSRGVNRNYYAGLMGIYYCILAYGKNYRKILYCFLVILIITLVFGYAGTWLGITFDAAKPERAYGGHSLGIIYPNNWGFVVFCLMILVWYMYLRDKKILTTGLFWIIAVFMVHYIDCMTIGILAFLFPILAIIAELIQEKEIPGTKCGNCLKLLIVALPILVFVFMMVGCWQMNWMHDHFYGTRIHTMAMRFVEGGYAIRLNGISLFGQPFQQMQEGIIDYLDQIDMKVDSAYVTYLLNRGVVWMIWILVWLTNVHRKCLKRGDYRLVVISIFMLLLAMMERPGLDAWFNFTLLYPLTMIDSFEKKSAMETGVKMEPERVSQYE